MTHNVWIYILVAAIVSLLIRALPVTVLRKQITSKFIRSFLYYVPYVTLSVMTFPAIIEATKVPLAGILALAVGVVIAWWKKNLFATAISCCAVVFITELIVGYIHL